MSSGDAYYNSTYHAQRYPELMGDDECFWARAEVQARFYFTPAERGLRIFEYGCGIGQGIAALPNSVGWDIGRSALDACRRRGLQVVERLEDTPQRAWDIVFCRHVLEHVEEPLKALQVMRTLIAPSGELYLIVPKESHHYCRINADLDQHLYSWTFATLNNLLFRAGFVPYRNEFRYMLGWQAFLPIRRYFGPDLYYWVTKWGGMLRRNGELVIRARVSEKVGS